MVIVETEYPVLVLYLTPFFSLWISYPYNIAMLQLSHRQLAALRNARLLEFIEAQPKRLRQTLPEQYADAFDNDNQALGFIDRLVRRARVAGIDDRNEMETLIDTCLHCRWTTNERLTAAGIDDLLADPAPSGSEKVTRIINAAAFASAASEHRPL